LRLIVLIESNRIKNICSTSNTVKNSFFIKYDFVNISIVFSYGNVINSPKSVLKTRSKLLNNQNKDKKRFKSFHEHQLTGALIEENPEIEFYLNEFDHIEDNTSSKKNVALNNSLDFRGTKIQKNAHIKSSKS
jgi:hypothetical protein